MRAGCNYDTHGCNLRHNMPPSQGQCLYFLQSMASLVLNRLSLHV